MLLPFTPAKAIDATGNESHTACAGGAGATLAVEDNRGEVVAVGEGVLAYSLDAGEAEVGLSAADIDVINAAEASNVTTIAFAGDIDSDKLVQVINQLPELEDLNLSALSASLPAAERVAPLRGTAYTFTSILLSVTSRV